MILEAALEGFSLVFSWPNILYPILGTLLAMCVAAMPGLSGLALMALAIPFTLYWDPLPVMLLFGAFVGGATFMGSVTSILFGIPGKASNAAVVFDGHPFALRGEARTAIGCSALSSALGSSFGVIVLILLIPLFERVVLLIGPPEFLLLMGWGLLTLSFVGRGTLGRNLIMVGLGFLLSTVGFDPRTAESRFTLGTLYLQDGVGFVPFFLGLFAVAETIELATSAKKTISGKVTMDQLGGSVWQGMHSVFRNFWLFLRCSLLGTVIGMIPGIGGTVASFVAYGHAAQSAKEPARFGEGDIRGVLAPEAANDAKDAGALVPTLAFGIPGGAGTAMLLGVLTLHGLAPGRELLTSDLALVFVLIWSLFLSNWLTSLLGIALVNPLARLTIIPHQILVSGIVILTFTGAFLSRYQVADMLLTLVFGIFGYYLKTGGWSRVSLVIAFVLGPHLERYLHLSARLIELDRIHLLQRPAFLVLASLLLASLLFGWSRRHRRSSR